MPRPLTMPAGHKWWTKNCDRKAGYSSELSARTIARDRLSFREPGSPDRLWPYACPGCRQWHLTKTPNSNVAITRREKYEGTGL